jgi:hypothetical protein
MADLGCGEFSIADQCAGRGVEDEECWEREIVYRWAHKMRQQTPQTITRYGAHGCRVWTARR